VPLVLLERYQILRFNGICFISFEFKMWDILKIEILLSLEIQQKSKMSREIGF
jgi:hypothetical protein